MAKLRLTKKEIVRFGQKLYTGTEMESNQRSKWGRERNSLRIDVCELSAHCVYYRSESQTQIIIDSIAEETVVSPVSIDAASDGVHADDTLSR